MTPMPSAAIGILNWENAVKGMLGMGGPDPAEVRRGEQLFAPLAAVLDAQLADFAIAAPLRGCGSGPASHRRPREHRPLAAAGQGAAGVESGGAPPGQLTHKDRTCSVGWHGPAAGSGRAP